METLVRLHKRRGTRVSGPASPATTKTNKRVIMNCLKQNGGILKDMNVHLLNVIESGGQTMEKNYE
eukprot:COSAG02_NODE_4199_length_5633_cov_4.504518_6_plen_66_part_00